MFSSRNKEIIDTFWMYKSTLSGAMCQICLVSFRFTQNKESFKLILHAMLMTFSIFQSDLISSDNFIFLHYIQGGNIDRFSLNLDINSIFSSIVTKFTISRKE